MINTNTVYIIIHLLGVVLGMGGAAASDFIFISSARDGRVTSTEERFIKLASRMVWAGLFIIVISGVLLFSLSPEKYLDSPKFLAKMTIVAIITLNGLVFHFLHLPFIRRNVGKHLVSSAEFTKKSWLLVSSGAVSVVSWISALVLGSMHKAPYAYASIIKIYVLILVLGILTALVLKNKLLRLR